MFSNGKIRLETKILNSIERKNQTPNELAKELEIVPGRLLKVIHYLEATGLLKRIKTPIFEGTIYEHEINTKYTFNGSRSKYGSRTSS